MAEENVEVEHIVLKNERDALALIAEELINIERKLGQINRNVVQFASMVEDNL